MIYNNPEFKKNIKLEFSATRLLIPTFILALTAWIGWSVGEAKSWKHLPLDYVKATSLTYWMFGFGFIFSIIWGSYLASNSLLSEMRQKTWDFMRMSSLAPEKILFGKLFGATSVVWTITLLGILPTILIASNYLFVDGGYHRPLIITLALLSCSIICWMIFSYTFVMLTGIYSYSKNDSRHTTIGSVLLILILGLVIGAAISVNYGLEFKISQGCPHYVVSGETDPMPCPANSLHLIDGIKYTAADVYKVRWYGAELFPLDTITFSIMFSAFWTVIGLYRTLRTSLQYIDAPYIWPIFWLSSVFYLNGYSYEDTHYNNFMQKLAIFFILSIGVTCIKESRNLIGYRQFYESLKKKKYKDAYRLTPLWLISLMLFAITSPFLFISSGSLASTYNFALFYMSFILLVVRDVFAIHLISWRKSVRMPTVGIAVYLLLMYGLAPFLAGIIFGKNSGAESFFMPISVGTMPHIITYMAIHTGLILLFFILLKKKADDIMTAKV